MRCKCSERLRPLPSQLAEGSNTRPRQWFVLRRNESCSAFNGYRHEWRDYSDVSCRVCGAHWRTKAAFVDSLRNCEFWPRQTAPRVLPFEELSDAAS